MNYVEDTRSCFGILVSSLYGLELSEHNVWFHRNKRSKQSSLFFLFTEMLVNFLPKRVFSVLEYNITVFYC